MEDISLNTVHNFLYEIAKEVIYKIKKDSIHNLFSHFSEVRNLVSGTSIKLTDICVDLKDHYSKVDNQALFMTMYHTFPSFKNLFTIKTIEKDGNGIFKVSLTEQGFLVALGTQETLLQYLHEFHRKSLEEFSDVKQ